MVEKMAPRISQSLIDRYSAGPSASRTEAAKKLHTSIRKALGTIIWDTFLQGSYRNSTATSQMKDVDIVALRRLRSGYQSPSAWEEFFEEVVETLRSSPMVGGTPFLHDKCIRLIGAPLHADIVPAVPAGDSDEDPINIYSRRNEATQPNYPRDHYRNGSIKNLLTDNNYKPTVRLMKRWATQWDDCDEVSPSFYIECAVHQVPNKAFNDYLPLSFLGVGLEICEWGTDTVINSVAGDKDILVQGEWKPSEFTRFQNRLFEDMKRVLKAIEATSAFSANWWWKRAFGE
jgi:hypothetical protein